MTWQEKTEKCQNIMKQEKTLSLIFMLIWFCVFNPFDDTAQHDMSQSCIPSSFVITLSTMLASLQFDTTMG